MFDVDGGEVEDDFYVRRTSDDDVDDDCSQLSRLQNFHVI